MNDYTKTGEQIWDETPVNISNEANFIWSIANKLRGSYMPDKYGDVIIPMTVIRRLECALDGTKKAVLGQFEANPGYPYKAMCKISGYPFFNTSKYTLTELCNDADNIAANFKAYIAGFSANVRDITNELELEKHIDKMDKDGCLFSVVKAFSELDLSPETFDSIKMGYIFEDLIGRFYSNVDAGQFFTARDITRLLAAVVMSEGCDDIFDDRKVITIGDQACGTGGMLTAAYDYIMHYSPTADVRLFGQEFMGQSYAVGLAEMLIKGQNAENFRHADTFKEDCFPDTSMRFVIMNPPFGTPWSGKDAKGGQEDAVRKEYEKGEHGRWGAGLPSGSDSQLIFMQSALAKMDDKVGRAAIIQNGSSLFTGGVSSGESQIRLSMLQHDRIEAIIALPTDMFYNTGIQTYVWILSKNKQPQRVGKIQLIDASSISHKLRKPMGNKKNELEPADRAQIVKLYHDFKETECSRIFDNEDFMYREYTVMQPLQRSYSITEESVERLVNTGALSSLYDEGKVSELENSVEELSGKDQRKLDAYLAAKPLYESVLETLRAAESDVKYLSPEKFMPVLSKVLADVTTDKKLLEKIASGLSVMDKEAEIQRDKKGNVIYDKETKDTETVPFKENIDDYMKREVLPYVPDAAVIGDAALGAEIGFTRIFYKYQPVEPVDVIMKRINERQTSLLKKLEQFSTEVGD